MAHAILMPKFGQMTETSVLTLWRKAVGDPVRRGDVLFEIETEKSAMEVEAFDDGVLLARLVAEGEEVPVSTVCGYVGEPGEAVPDAAPAPAAEVARESPVMERAPRPGGASPATIETDRIRISPRATRLAAELGVDPRTIAGTGPGGRIVERDVTAASAMADEAAVAAAAPARQAGDDEEAARPLSRMRRVIAERLTLSVTTIPTFTVTVAADVTGLLALRRELSERGSDLTVTDFVLAATAQSLADFPDVNARTDGVSVWPRRRINLGLAVSVPGGLLVPVIHDADRLSVDGLHARALRLAAAARDGTLSPDDLSGGTFTVSNLGMLGIEEFRAIINPGESGILAVGSALETPVAIDGGIAIRSIMRLTLTADHRLVDGELGARFLNAIRRRLEDHRTTRRASLEG